MTEPPPRFDAGGFDADAYGASDGYPLGDRTTFFETRSLVGSFSHLDEIFPGRRVRQALAPSRLVRISSRRSRGSSRAPSGRWTTISRGRRPPVC